MKLRPENMRKNGLCDPLSCKAPGIGPWQSNTAHSPAGNSCSAIPSGTPPPVYLPATR